MTEAAKHTPGKWLLIRDCGKDDSAIATQEVAPETMTEPNYWAVAFVNTQRDEWQANARLIAAAPLLLEAAQRSLNWLSSYPGGCTLGPNGPYEQMRAAIAAATVSHQ